MIHGQPDAGGNAFTGLRTCPLLLLKRTPPDTDKLIVMDRPAVVRGTERHAAPCSRHGRGNDRALGGPCGEARSPRPDGLPMWLTIARGSHTVSRLQPCTNDPSFQSDRDLPSKIPSRLPLWMHGLRLEFGMLFVGIFWIL